MESTKVNNSKNENQAFQVFIDKLLQKKMDAYNLELLIQCERNPYSVSNIQEKSKEIEVIKEDINNLKVLKNPDHIVAMIS